jgi:dihydrofolate reductase
MRLVVINHVTLDGVMQAPGRPDEDTRGGFSHGGWAIPGNDEVMGRALGGRMGKPDGGLLFGRWSYESLLSSWNAQGVPAAVADLKQNATGDLMIMGSGQLIRSLLPHELIDEYLLMIHPLILGSGQRLFEQDGHLAKLRLVTSTPTTAGVIIATYQPA